MRRLVWVALSLLCVAGAWLFWRLENRPAQRGAAPAVFTTIHSSSTAPNLLAGTLAATNVNQAGAVKTNRYAYRLSNTAKPLGELVNDRHAILLENALIDTRNPLNLSIPKQLQTQGDPGAYIVQARGPINAAFRALLASAGAEIVSYIPNDAYLVRASAAVAGGLTANPLTQSVIPYEPYYKISASMPMTAGQREASSTPRNPRRPAGPSLLTLALKQAPLPEGTYLTLGLFSDGAAATEAQIEKLGGQIVARDRSPFGPVVRVQPPADWVALATLPGVQIVEPYRPRVHANDLSRAKVGVAADTQVATNYLGLTGAGVMVEVNDSGIDATHPDFMTAGGAPLRVIGYSPLSLVDTNGHGTHVAGIIAGDGTESMTVSNAQGSIIGTNGVAVAGQFRGMAPQATLFSVSAFGNGFGRLVSDQSLQEIPALTNALISNNSWNYDGDNAYDLAAASYDAATRDALAGLPGSQPVLFVFSAGNDGGGDDSSDPGDGTADTILSPATAKDVITVGAIQEHRNITNMVTTITVNPDGTTTTNLGEPWQPETSTSYRVAGFSARGNVGIETEGQFGRFKPDVVAPGTFVISTRSSQWDITDYFLINPTNYDFETFSNIIAQPDSLWASIFPTIPNNTVGVSIEVDPNPDSPSPFPTLPIFVGLYTSPNVYDFTAANNPFVVPGDANAASAGFTIQQILNTEGFWGFNYGVSNSTTEPISFNVTTDVITTNNPGDYYLVLSNLDQSIGKPNPNSTGPGPYYRYETGTSMSAADVSGVLALMQQFFTNTLQTTPSPALMKAALINGARVSNAQVYNLEVTNTINHEGWGLVNLTNSLPGVIANQFNTPCDDFFVDQSPTNALATGDSHTYTVAVNVSTNSDAQNLPLRVTLAWTDPPGDPAAAIKLVNGLELVVTNSDDPTNPLVYYGNDIGSGQTYNTPENPTNAVSVDAINNVQNVFIYPQPGTNYTITVIGREVNANAVTEQTNNVVQDYALVVSCGEGEVTNAFTVTDGGILSNPTTSQDITFVITTNQPLLNQFAGANTPLLGTNTVQYGSTNALVTVGMTNQWHFYVVTNNAVDSSGNTSDVTNAVFITFDANTLSIPREGVFANSDANSTRPQADIDLYATTDPGLTNLDPVVLSNCVNGTQVGLTVAGIFNGASLTRGGTEFVADTNSEPGEVYYVGVKSEDQMAAEYDFIPIFTSIPLDQMNANGDQVVNGLNEPVAIPDGSPAHPGAGLVFGVAIYPIQVERVIVTNQVWHQNYGDLIGTLTLNGALPDVLNNHDSIGNTIGRPPMIYDDSGQGDIPGSRPSDGPGSLKSYTGQDGFGVWMLAEVDDSPTQIGTNESLTLLIQPHRPLTGGTTNTVPPHSWFYDYVDVPPGYTNLSVYGTNLPPVSNPALQLYLNVTNPPTFSDYLFEADLTNSPPGQPPYPAGLNPGNSISYGPPLQPARYWVGVYNPDTVAHSVYLLATLGGSLAPVPPSNFSTNGPALLNDAVTTNSIFISNTQLIASVNVGIVVAHPRISDLTFTLVSPTGQSVLLMENRGGDTTNGAGNIYTYTNVLNSTATGGAAASTNYLAVSPLGGAVPITFNFYTVPDEMTVYEGTSISPANLILDTGFISNPPGGTGAQNTLPLTTNAVVQPGFTNIIIIMNQFGNPYATGGGDAWIYTAGSAFTNYQYLMFTEDTNLTTLPIKYAVPPYSFTETATNYTLSDFELATNGNYLAPTNIYDAFGGWTMPTNRPAGTNLVMWTNNLVSVVTDPSDSLGDHAGSNFLALAGGTIIRSIPTVPGRQYNVTFWYRGPGIAGWWRGEGNASDSSQAEGGNNGSLIGRFNFPAGEVGQAFEFEDAGQAMEFAGTNTYVQIRQSPSLDAGAGGGFTVEGWINPTNVTQQMPLVEWLAKVPVFTNSADTNFSIIAGPFLNPATDHYYYLLAATNWTTSETWATNLGGHLVTLDTANEQNWVYDAFANYGGTNRNLWIGLTNSYNGTTFTFGYSSGLTNVVYTNWANSQPDNTCGTANYTFMFANTNTPGLWTLADNNGFTCASPAATNQVFGVVEVTNLQPNGVQFWISVTNTPGTTNAAFVSSNGCLYANLVDTTNGSHEIYSAPGLIQSNIYQHVALTYNTNSGLATLYYNGTNVATTNLGVFFPKTGGDVLLGKDMGLLTNGYYGGEMDEMSIYSRALSGAEIAAIYQVSAFATNGLTGKFDPSVTPAYGLAEAQVAFGTTTNILLGVDNQWELNSFTFTATSNAMPLQITGLEPGILLDDFTVSETPLTNLYYLPEQSLDELAGTPANGTGNSGDTGTWTLQIWDNRANAAVSAADAQLLSWELQFVLQTNALDEALPMAPQGPTTITVPPGQIVYLSVDVPSWAFFATNVLDSATGPVDLLFNPTNLPTGANPGDLTLLTASTGGIGMPPLAVNSPFPLTAANQAGTSYYLGVRNNGAHAVTAVVEADFDITTLSNGVPYSDTLNTTNHSERYFAYEVSTNAIEATFQLLDLNGNADLVASKGPRLPTLTSSDYGSFNEAGADQNIYVFTNSQPVPLSPGLWYLGVFNRDASPVNYNILAKELDTTNGTPGYTIINLTNRVPFDFTAGPGAALTNFFLFNVTDTSFLVTNAVNAVITNTLGSIHFELYNLSGNGDLTVQTDAPPFAPPFLESSQQPGTAPELITIRTNGVFTNLVGQWYLGVPNNETNLITYTIVAVMDTNLVFPAFPGAEGAEGAGADAIGGRFGDVYHVTTNSDSGPGTLRDAVSVQNRTVVFDVSGTIYLLSPLVITNSFLTIAGQTAPGGGITVAGNITTVQSAHDVVIRDMRFRPGVAGGIALTNSFEGTNAADYTSGQMVANSGWRVMTNQVSLVTDAINAYGGESNFLALANGTISNTLPTVAGTGYTLTFAYRGPGIAGWWRGENTTKDSINGNNATTATSILYPAGEVGRAFLFNGTSSLITIPASTSLAVSNVTMEAWIFPTDLSSMQPIFDYGGAGQSANIHLWINTTGGSSLNPGGLHSLLRNVVEVDDANPVVQVNQWNHIAFTANFVSASGGNATFTGTLYCNGVPVMTSTGSGPLLSSYEPVNLGYRDSASTEQFATRGLHFKGDMDEASIYNRALSDSEIKAIYNLGTNHTGKFDTNSFSISPAQSLAEAQVSLNGQTQGTLYGNNTNWQVETLTFVATQNGTPVQISGIEPGMLLDSSSLAAIINPDDALRLTNVSDVIADHVSTSWSTNNLMSVLDSTNVTVQWSVMADSLTNNLRGYGSRLRYGNGALTFDHNLYADNHAASPRLGDNLKLDFVNNVIYNWGVSTGFSTNDIADNPSGFTNELNYVCNYLIAGSNSVMTNIAFWSGTTNTWIFQTNNFIDSNTNGILDGTDTGWNMFTNYYTPFEVPFPPLAVSIDEAYLAYERVLDFAGVAMDKRDAADTNIVLKVRTQTGALISSAGTLPPLNSTLPYLDTDQDGIPDFWEITFGTDPYAPNNDVAASDGSGYTDLEEYNNWLAGPHALTVTNTPVGVDLMQLFGKTGNLSFSATNAVQGFVYLTNVLGSVTNTSAFSNSIAIFTPTNNAGAATNYSGFASFDVYVTNNDTIAYFGPVTVSIVVSKVPVLLNSNMPPVITPLISGLLDPTNYGGSDFYKFTVTTNSAGGNAVGVLFTVTDASGPVDLLANYGLPLPSLSSYDYISTNSWTTSENILVTPNSTPVALTNGDWYLAVVNVSGSNVTYSIEATELFTVVPPVFSSPTNGNVFTNIETTPFTVTCVATDSNTPPLPLTFALVNQPANISGATNVMTINPATGVINWTPNEAQGPSTNLISVSVANGVFSVTNSFTIIVEESNLPPVLPSIPNQVVIVPGSLVVTNTATDPDIPANPLTYTLLTAPTSNALIDTNGIITWMPTLAQAGTNYLFTTIVTDTNPWAVNATSLSATNSFYVTLATSTTGGSPQTNTVPGGGINWLAVSVPTNAIAATNILLYATNLPVNVWFSTNVPPSITNANDVDLMPNTTNGTSVLTTHSAPTNIVPGGVYFLGVQNTNIVAVAYSLEVNFLLAAPTSVMTNTTSISSIVQTNIGGKNGFLLTWFAPSNDLFQVQWTASLAPASWSAFTNIVSYNAGAFTSPTNTQFNFFDDGSQTGGFGPQRFYRLTLLQATNTLILPSQSNLVATASATIIVTNTATDSSAGAVLTYSLVNPPANASISTNGIITWTNAIPSGSATRFTTLVTDNGVPPSRATNTFTVFVTPFPSITQVTVTATNAVLQWSAPTNDQFQVQWATNLAPVINWFTYPAILTSINGTFTFTDTNAPLVLKFYRLLLLP